ncbi:MAG: hypothetical protein HY343_10550 [Lentisphaerae bacterium]|nr:hypothetical protein [Lentisphaerota bacterium]
MNRIFLFLVSIVAALAAEAGNTNDNPLANKASVACGACYATTNCVIQHEPTAARLRAITVPTINFRNAAMSYVVEFLANGWHCMGHPWVYPEQTIQGRIDHYQDEES